MALYYTPGVYVEQAPRTFKTLIGLRSSIAAFIGITESGEINKAVFVSSWVDYVDKFAYKMKSPFFNASDLGYAVYGFFQNGGLGCYIISIKGTTPVKATASLGASSPIVFTAISEGAHGNTVSVEIMANADVPANFDIKVYSSHKTGSAELVERYINVVTSATASNFYASAINGKSKLITCATTGTLSVVAKTALATGDDDIDTINDASYTDVLPKFDIIENIGILAIPGQTSTTVQDALALYVNARKSILGVFDLSASATPSQAKTARNLIACERGAVYYPTGYIIDPLSPIGALRIVPNSGHVAGYISQSVQKYGSGKAPAGVSDALKGFVKLVTVLSNVDTDLLNPASVNCLLVKSGYGVVVWGARSTSTEVNFRYISDILLFNEIYNTLKYGMMWAVFEPNNPILWAKVTAMAQGYLDEQWKKGFFMGEKSIDAYFVKCDAENNTPEKIAEGIFTCDIGYARVLPAEFVVFTISNSLTN